MRIHTDPRDETLATGGHFRLALPSDKRHLALAMPSPIRRCGQRQFGWTRFVAMQDQYEVALAWLLAKPVVSAPIVGATKPHRLADTAVAVAVTLTVDEIRQLEELYRPQALYRW